MWNCNEAAVEAMPKTNNSVEGWHRGFESTVETYHPNVFRFIEALLREQVLTETKYEEKVAGEPPKKKKKIYRDNAARLQRLVQKYNSRDPHDNVPDPDEDDDHPILAFLRGVAHNIAY